jgi:hypothetical protein
MGEMINAYNILIKKSPVIRSEYLRLLTPQ